jgi:hypothetical protein
MIFKVVSYDRPCDDAIWVEDWKGVTVPFTENTTASYLLEEEPSFYQKQCKTWKDKGRNHKILEDGTLYREEDMGYWGLLVDTLDDLLCLILDYGEIAVDHSFGAYNLEFVEKDRREYDE